MEIDFNDIRSKKTYLCDMRYCEEFCNKAIVSI